MMHKLLGYTQNMEMIIAR